MNSLARRMCLTGVLLSTTSIFAACAPSTGRPPPAAIAQDVQTITVVGRGEAAAKPDIARIHLGVDVTGQTVAEATTTAASEMGRLLSALKNAGIAEKDIQTSNFSINREQLPDEPMPMPMPMPAPPARPGAPRGLPQPAPVEPRAPRQVYRVSNTVVATIRDLARVGAVLDAAVAAGANNVWGVHFGLDKTDAIEAQAREKAVADARARAEALSRLQGVALGGVVAMSEIVDGGPGFAVPFAAKAALSEATPIAPGEITFGTQVKVIYALDRSATAAPPPKP